MHAHGKNKFRYFFLRDEMRALDIFCTAGSTQKKLKDKPAKIIFISSDLNRENVAAKNQKTLFSA